MWRTLLRDPVIRVAAGPAVVAAVPYVFPVLSPAAMELYGETLSDVPLLLATLVAFQFSRLPKDEVRERRFWNLLTAGITCWLLVRAVNLGPSDTIYWRFNLDVVEDVLYAGLYLCFILALELRPHLPSSGQSLGKLERYQVAGAIISVFGLLVYFVIIPSSLNRIAYDTWLPSLLLFVAFDLYLLLRALTLRHAAESRKWRAVYTALALTAALWAATDGYEALLWAGAVPYVPAGTPLDLAWLPTYGTLIVAGRLGRGVHPTAPAQEKTGGRDILHGFWGGPLVIYVLAFPALHFGLYGVGLLDETTRVARELWLTVILVLLALLAFAYQRATEEERERLEAERQAATEQLQFAKRMETLGQLTGGIAHDFNNILTIILANADLMREALPPDSPVHAELDELSGAAQRGGEMVRKLLGFGRKQLLALETVDLTALVTDFGRALRNLVPAHIEVELACDEAVPPVRADPGAVEQILMNLVTNARDAMPQGGHLRIATSVREVPPAEGESHADAASPQRYGCLTVSDTGTGMDDATRAKLFEPFFTTKPRGEGTGLGLAMVYGLVEQHGGRIDVWSRPGAGTTVEVLFPVAAPAADTRGALAETASAPPAGRTILVAEDEAAIRHASQRALEAHGYRVLVARDGREALDLYRAHRQEIGLVLTDIVMPRMSGTELYAAIRQEDGTAPFLFMTGYALSELESGTLPDPRVPILNKPWTLDELIAAVGDALDESGQGDHRRH